MPKVVFLQKSPKFEIFSYTDQVFDKSKSFSIDTKIGKIKSAIFSVCIMPFAVSFDLMTLSFRFIRHLKIFNEFNKQNSCLNKASNNLIEGLKYLNFYLGKFDKKEFEFKKFGLTNSLIERLEKKISESSRIKKVALSIIAAIVVNFMIVADIFTYPIRFYNHLKSNANLRIIGEKFESSNRLYKCLAGLATFSYIFSKTINYYRFKANSTKAFSVMNFLKYL